MQRQSLVPLKSFMDRKGSVDGSGLNLLEVAGGTGRFATFVKVSDESLSIPKRRYRCIHHNSPADIAFTSADTS